MNNYTLISPTAQYLQGDGQWWLCPKSQLALDVKYEGSELRLPLSKRPEITLGEGNTPLLELEALSKMVGCNIWAKCEFLNPTGSFKDRGSVVEVSKALELSKKGLVCASTGNMAASLSAYAAKIGLACIVVVPEQTPISKLRQALVCGATLKKVRGNYDQCVAIAEKIAKAKNYFLCGDYVVRREGQKSIGWELAQSTIAIDLIVIPVGNGTVGVATMKGFAEILTENNTKKLPKFIGIQAKNANPLERAWKNNQPIKPINNSKTIASAFNVGNPIDGWLVLDWVKKTSGSLFSVSDTKIKKAQKLLAQTEGLYVETAAAATLAGIIENKKDFIGKTAVLLLTGSGLKEQEN